MTDTVRSCVTIRDVVYPGRGLATLDDGRILFVPGTLPGERVSVAILKTHRHYAVGGLLDIIEPAPRRIAAACGHGTGGGCPGCVYQHVDYPYEVELKHGQLGEMLRRMGKFGGEIRLPPMPSPIALHYRNKIVLHAARDADGVKLGYIRADNTTVHDIASCMLAMEPINAALTALRADADFMTALKPGMGLTFRHTRSDGTVYWRANESVEPACLTEDTPFGPVEVPRRSFYQINPAAANLLFAEVGDMIRRIAPEFVIDLYCGIGIFALAALHGGAKTVFGIDCDSRAIRAARHNVSAHRFDNQALFMAQSAYEGLQGIPAHVAPPSTLVIVDPPRTGLDRDVIQLLCAVKPAHVLYVACAPDTLARDMARFCAGGYEPRSARIVDLFPRTPHFETVLHLAR